MLTEFDTTLPSIRQVQNLIKQTIPVELKLLTGDVLIGKILWQDPQCICIADENSQQTTIWKHAIAYIKPKTSEVSKE
ncbi:MAG: Hfq-related RNA-binding protein [Nostoc sp.]